MAYCANRPLQDVFYIGEMASTDDTCRRGRDFPQQADDGELLRRGVLPLGPGTRSDRGIPEPILLPPSGYIAGLYARIDASRGVWKAPAGTEASLNGVVGLAAELTDVQHGNLNPLGCQRHPPLPGRPASFALARARSASDPEWKYVPVRRTAIMLRVSIYYGIQWAVFEPNDEPLWSQLRLNIGSFMTTLFRQGAFQGVDAHRRRSSSSATRDDHPGRHRSRHRQRPGRLRAARSPPSSSSSRSARRPGRRPPDDGAVHGKETRAHGQVHRQQHTIRPVPRLQIQGQVGRPSTSPA